MGPQSTINLYQKIVDLTVANRDQDHIPLLIYNLPQIPDRTKSIISGKHFALPYLVDAIHVFEHAKINQITIACNTAHYYLDYLQTITKAKLISMIDLVERYYIKEVITGRTEILGTVGTTQSRIYVDKLSKLTEVIPLTQAQQDVTTRLIYEVKNGNTGKYLNTLWLDLILSLKAENIILACTELPIIYESCDLAHTTRQFINPTHLLAQEIIKLSKES